MIRAERALCKCRKTGADTCRQRCRRLCGRPEWEWKRYIQPANWQLSFPEWYRRRSACWGLGGGFLLTRQATIQDANPRARTLHEITPKSSGASADQWLPSVPKPNITSASMNRNAVPKKTRRCNFRSGPASKFVFMRPGNRDCGRGRTCRNREFCKQRARRPATSPKTYIALVHLPQSLPAR